MKVSIIISICDNRYNLFKRALDTWVKQTMPKEDFELIIVDDDNRTDINQLCKLYSKQLQIKYIRIDNSKCDKPITTFLPILSNNIGFRKAIGEVVVVTGPETLQSEKNVEISYTFVNKNQCAYGLVFRANTKFVRQMDIDWDKYNSFSELLNVSGSQDECRTRPPHPPAYWYFMAVAKKNVDRIGGVDEDFATGICAEDDDFANRMNLSGIRPVFEHNIIGIHQDHSFEDSLDQKHNIRSTEDGKLLRQRNVDLMRKNLLNKKIIANSDHIWGDEKVIISYEEL